MCAQGQAFGWCLLEEKLSWDCNEQFSIYTVLVLGLRELEVVHSYCWNLNIILLKA